MFEGIDGFGAVEQQVEVGGDALPVGGEFVGVGAVGECAQQGAHKLGVLRGFELALSLVVIGGIGWLIDHLAGISLFGAMVRETIALRRSQHERLSAESPADAFVIERGRWQPPVDAATSTDVPGDALKGTPAAGGRARGRAAVLRDVQEAARMQRGDILVTKQTDPGWGPVLFLAKALVIERGGMLSHGAIIAREFGVPCVVGVKNASTRIAHGAHIDVDGDRGLVIEVAEVPPLLKTTPKTKTKASTMSLEASA